MSRCALVKKPRSGSICSDFDELADQFCLTLSRNSAKAGSGNIVAGNRQNSRHQMCINVQNLYEHGNDTSDISDDDPICSPESNSFGSSQGTPTLPPSPALPGIVRRSSGLLKNDVYYTSYEASLNEKPLLQQPRSEELICSPPGSSSSANTVVVSSNCGSSSGSGNGCAGGSGSNGDSSGGGGGGSDCINGPNSVGEGKADMEEHEISWKRGNLIGCGAFGKVYVGLNNETGEFLAVKQIHVDPSSEETSRNIEEFRREVTILKTLRHVNIVRYLGMSVDFENLNIFLECKLTITLPLK